MTLYVWEGSEREQCHLLCSLSVFSHFPCYPQSNWALLVLIPGWVVLCIFKEPVCFSNKLSCEAGSFSLCRNPHRFFQSEILRLYFPMLELWVEHSVLLPSCSSWFIHTQMWDCLLLEPPSCLAASPLHPAAHLRPSYLSG